MHAPYFVAGLLRLSLSVFFTVIRFVARQGIMFSQYKSLLGGSFHFCVSRFKFSESAFLDNKIYVTLMVKNTVYRASAH